MQRKNNILTVFQMIIHVLDLARIYMRHGHLYRARKVNDRLVVCSRLPYIQNSVAHFCCIVNLCAGEALRTVLEPVICMSLFRQLLQKLCALYGNLQNLFF